jgi:hypothetical protein
LKQILLSLKTGRIEAADVPAPAVRPGTLLIRTHVSLISSGAERVLLEFGYCNAGEVIAVGEGGGL